MSDRYTANVLAPNYDLNVVANVLMGASFDVEVIPGAHGVVAQKDGHSLDAFLEELEGQLSPFRDIIIDDYGPCG